MSQIQDDTSKLVPPLLTPNKAIIANTIRLLLSLGAGFVTFNVATAVYHRVASPLSQLEIAPKQLHLGDVAQGRLVTASVTLLNKSSQTLHITRATPGCGCTSVNAPKELLPGKPTPLTVTYDTEGPTGAIHKGLTVMFAELPNKPVHIAINGNVHEEIRLTPAKLSLDTVDGGTRYPFQFTATRLDGHSLSLKPIDLPATARIRIKQTASTVVHVSGTLTAPLLPEEYTHLLRFQTDDAALPEIKTELSYSVRPRFVVEPKIANFGAIAPDDKPEMSLTIHGRAPVHLQSVPKGIRVNLVKQKSDGVYTLTITPTGQGKGKILSERLVLATDDSKQPYIIVPVYCVLR